MFCRIHCNIPYIYIYIYIGFLICKSSHWGWQRRERATGSLTSKGLILRGAQICKAIVAADCPLGINIACAQVETLP